jgi:hypothetical protein
VTTYTCPDGHSSQSGDYCDVCGAPISPTGAAPAGASPAAASQAAATPAAAASSLSLDPAGPPPLPTPSGPAGAPGARVCPNCSASNPPGALFCEDCGYDFTTGQLPRPLDPPSGPNPPATGPAPHDANAVLDAAADPDTNPSGVPSSPAAAPVAFVAELWVDPDWYAAQDVTDPCPSAGMPVVVPIRGTSVLVGRTSASRNIHPEIDVAADTGVSRRHAQLTTDGQRWWVEDLQSANGTFVGTAGDPLPTTAITPGQRVELPDEGRVYLGAWTRMVVRKASPSEQAP